MFDLFRSRDKAVRILLTVILGVVALSMITYLIPGSGMGGGSADTNIVATVAGEPITAQEAQQLISNMMRGRNLPPEILAIYAPQLINTLIKERAMAYEAKRLGFQVSEAETAKAVHDALPPQLFQDGKLVSKDLYVSVLAEQGLTVQQFEKQAADQVLVNRLRELISAGVVVSPREVENEYRKRSEKAKIDYVLMPQDKYKAGVQVSEEEARTYFAKHRTDYQMPERKALAVVEIDPANLQSELEPAEADLRRLYQSSMDSFRSPESVTLRHILLKTDGKNDAQVKAKIEDLEKQLKAGGNFSELAKKYSEDPGSAAKGGVYENVVRGQMVKEFEAAAFSLAPGQISQPVKTAYGYHILQVIEKNAPRLKPFEEAKAQLTAEYKSKKMNQVLQTAEDKAVSDLRKDPNHPEKAAEDSKGQLFNVASYAPGDPLPGAGPSKEVDQAVIGLKKGEVSQPVVLAGNKIVIAVATSVTPAHPSAFEEVSSQVKTKLAEEKLKQLISDKASELAAKAKASGDFKKAAKEMGLEVKVSEAFTRSGAIEGVGSGSTFEDAFTKPVNTILGPYPAQSTVVVAQVTGHEEANMADFPVQRDSLRETLRNSKGREREAIFSNGLEKRLEQEKKIKVNNDVLKNLIANYSHS
jgi:peptidyl-prolyl cis-trans isomerase D